MNQTSFSRYNVDISLILASIFLIIIGILFIYSAGHTESPDKFFQHYIKQLIALIPGIILFFIFLFINYQKLKNYTIIFYILAILLLVAVLIFGTPIHGSKSWFSFSGISFQPSELTKLLFIFTLAKYIEWCGKNILKFTYFIIALIIPAPIVALIILQNDPGTALVYMPITIIMLIIGGADIKHLSLLIFTGIIFVFFSILPNYFIKKSELDIKKDRIEVIIQQNIVYSMISTKEDIRELNKVKLSTLNDPVILKNELKKKNDYIKNLFMLFLLKVIAVCIVLMIIGYIFYKIFKAPVLYYFTIAFLVFTIGFTASIGGQKFLKPHHITRILGIFNLNEDPQGSSYNQRQSVIAIGSGGILGHGLLNGPQNRLNYIPEKVTDFIFAVIGEEWGFLRGSLLILALYSIIIYRGFMIAYNAKDYYGTLLAVGITTIFFSHIFINLSMCIGLWPVMGLPLPFLSAGGTSLITGIIGIALLMNISQKRYVH